MEHAHTISKTASDPHRYKRAMIPFQNARTAFRAFMQALALAATDVVLLPSFVGWSPKDGSGIFDPIQTVGAQHDFYRMTRRLEIDLEDLQFRLQEKQPRLVVLIHYFGFPDSNYPTAVRLAQAAGARVLEDEAHALYTDLIGGMCGRLGDAAIFSLHKMLPLSMGGMLVLNKPQIVSTHFVVDESLRELDRFLFEYDLYAISQARRHNAAHLLELLEPLQDHIEPLYPILLDGIVPQTLPVIIHTANRDQLYFELNARGFGVVTLYHTLIKSISEQTYPDSHWLAQRILNLPVHQDISSGSLDVMIDTLKQLT